ncbi:MAG: SAM-dependent methyltransferase [Anaerofustis stercorihominis]|nr:SAM-dependent methyltransferase [Anaerofustis stercorihominis]
MKLDKRLTAVCSLVPEVKTVADVGSDHAYLPVYLLLNSIAQRAIVTDVNAGPLENGKETCRRFGVYDRCDFRLGSGLSVLKENEAEAITICGMGGELMKSILAKDERVAKSAKYLILQPQSGFDELNEYLYNNGFGVIDEKIVHEKHLYYRIIMCSADTPVRKDDFLYPSYLAEKKDATYFDFLKFRLDICENIIRKIKDSQKENEDTLSQLDAEKRRINEVLGIYENQGNY